MMSGGVAGAVGTTMVMTFEGNGSPAAHVGARPAAESENAASKEARKSRTAFMGLLLVALNWVFKSCGDGHGAMMWPRTCLGNRKATRFYQVKP
jgi:hypothetical protein